MPNLIVCIVNNAATAARRTFSAAAVSPPRPADRALSSGTSPASEATIPAASSSRSSTAGTLRSLPVTPLATIDASQMTRPAHTNSAKAAPRAPQRRITSCVSGYPQALSPRTTAPIGRFISWSFRHPERPGLQPHFLHYRLAVYDHLAALVVRGRAQLQDPFLVAFVRDRHHDLDGVADPDGSHEVQVLAEVNRVRPGKLGAQHRGDQPPHEHAVRDPLPEHRLRGVFGIDVNRVHVPGETGVIDDVDFGDRPGERGLIADLDVLVG